MDARLFYCDLSHLRVAYLTLPSKLESGREVHDEQIWIHRPMAKCVTIGRRIICILCFAALSTAVGCGDRRSYIVDPVVSSKAAIEQYDKNGDALLDETELKDCPALLSALRAFDDSKDKKLSREEIAERNRLYVSTKSWIDRDHLLSHFGWKSAFRRHRQVYPGKVPRR